MNTTTSAILRRGAFGGAFGLALTLMLIQPVTWPAVAVAAEASDESSTDASVGVRAGAYALTPFYFLAKVVYAGAGAVTGGLAWAVTGGNNKTAYAVWDPSLKGDYWVTPSHLKGERPLQFVGKRQERHFEGQESPSEPTPSVTQESPGMQDRPPAQPQSSPNP